jgi:hypothetical protein
MRSWLEHHCFQSKFPASPLAKRKDPCDDTLRASVSDNAGAMGAEKVAVYEPTGEGSVTDDELGPVESRSGTVVVDERAAGMKGTAGRLVLEAGRLVLEAGRPTLPGLALTAGPQPANAVAVSVMNAKTTKEYPRPTSRS